MKTSLILILFCISLNSCNSIDQHEIDQVDQEVKETDHTEPSESVETSPILDLSDSNQFKLVEISMLNPHQLSPKKLQNEKDRILKIQPSIKYFEWENPTSGGAVHINIDDNIEVYNCILNTSDSTFKEIEIDELWQNVSGISFGNAPSVLITSECDIHKSKTIELVINELFDRSVRVFYIERNE